MVKYIYLILFVFCSPLLWSQQIFEVCLSGDKPFTSIQAAINVAGNNNIVRVYPGDYYGELDIGNRRITLESLYATTGDTLYIYTTRLIAQYPETVLSVGTEGASGNMITVNGFTISNNLSGNIHPATPPHGRGLTVRGGNATIKNNIFTQNYSSSAGAALGLGFTGHMDNPRTIHLENNKIFDNISYFGAGGLLIRRGINVIFSQEYRNSIYNNIGTRGQDITIWHPSLDLDIYLDIGSRIITEIDNCYVYAEGLNSYIGEKFVTIDVLREGLPAYIYKDLYVAPLGDDNNSGLHPSNPLKSIYYATSIVGSNHDNPNTVHLAEGIFTRSDGQYFPFHLRGGTILKGAGIDITILDDEFFNHVSVLSGKESETKISNLTLQNIGNSNALGSPIWSVAHNPNIENVKIINNHAGYAIIAEPIVSNNDNEMGLGEDTITMKNVIIKDSYGASVAVHLFSHIHFENIIIDNLDSGSERAVGFVIYGTPNQIINNFSFTNSRSLFHNTIFLSTTSHQSVPIIPGLAVYNNFLIANNYTFDPFPMGDVIGKVLINRSAHSTVMNNWTIAHNTGTGYALRLPSLDTIVNNIILYNPDLTYELAIGKIDGYDNQLTINNSLMYNNKIEIGFGVPDPILNNLIFDPPQFAGQFNNNLTPDMWEFYYLHHVSPAIDTGIDVSEWGLFDYDLAGNPRVYGNAIDMGAFEFQGLVASFTAEPRVGPTPLTVQFTDLSYGGSVYAWEWDFGISPSDRTRNHRKNLGSFEQNPLFTYEEEGVYSVTLTINGEKSITKTDFIIVTSSAFADFSAEPTTGTAPLEVQFTCLSTGAFAWEWDFNNDGTVDSTEQNPVFTYLTSGIYTVTLTINNGEDTITKQDYIDSTVNDDDETALPFMGVNLQSYPNPVNISRSSNTLISFNTQNKAASEPIIEIYNIRGQKIRTLKTGMSFYDLAVIAGLAQENLDLISSRNYSVIWDMRDDNKRLVGSGIYFYRAIVDGEIVGTNRMVVIK